MFNHLQFSRKKIISAIFLLFFSSLVSASVPNNQAKIAQAAVSISQTTTPASVPRVESIEFTAARIVSEWAQEDPDFSTSCGIQADCYTFWTMQFEMQLTAEVAAEDARQARCSQARTEYSTKDCGARDFNPPPHDFAVRFSAQVQHVFFRPILRDFHTQIFNDATGSSINNFSSVLTQLRQACDNNITIVLDRNFCRLDANNYFGQGLLGGGLQDFLNSPAGNDARPNLYGSTCNAIRERLNADQCGAWPT
jgi:hypothetical protein